jgi:hypothetical protein
MLQVFAVLGKDVGSVTCIALWMDPPPGSHAKWY